MNKVRKLTPAVLKRIIKEEKQKIAKEKQTKRSTSVKSSEINDIALKTIKEARLLVKLKRLQEKTRRLKRDLTKNKQTTILTGAQNVINEANTS